MILNGTNNDFHFHIWVKIFGYHFILIQKVKKNNLKFCLTAGIDIKLNFTKVLLEEKTYLLQTLNTNKYKPSKKIMG